MKTFNNYLGLFLIAFSLVASSCSKQDLALEIAQNNSGIKKVTSAGVVLPILVDDAAYNIPSSFFSALNFTIEDEIIMLTSGYSGGCGVVTFKLVAESKITLTSNNTPVVNVRLLLDNNSKCKDLLEKVSKFDLTPLNKLGSGHIILNVERYGMIDYYY